MPLKMLPLIRGSTQLALGRVISLRHRNLGLELAVGMLKYLYMTASD
jgi:hypothetical protein